MTVCCIPQQNPSLYPVVHKLIHRLNLCSKLTSITQSFSLQFPASKKSDLVGKISMARGDFLENGVMRYVIKRILML
ncbi:hypothetical protein CU276_20450 [Yersinia kristensenii]|nr:hypothetical protein CU276_20450 [Yersinia kristensenii]